MPNVLITGAGRRAGIAAACALTMARTGWDVGLSCWRPYDQETGPVSADHEPFDLVEELRSRGIRAELAEADLGDPAAPARLFDELKADSDASRRLLPPTAATSNFPSFDYCGRV